MKGPTSNIRDGHVPSLPSVPSYSALEKQVNQPLIMTLFGMVQRRKVAMEEVTGNEWSTENM